MDIQTAHILGDIARVFIYNPVTYALMLLIFLLVILSEIDHD